MADSTCQTQSTATVNAGDAAKVCDRPDDVTLHTPPEAASQSSVQTSCLSQPAPGQLYTREELVAMGIEESQLKQGFKRFTFPSQTPGDGLGQCELYCVPLKRTNAPPSAGKALLTKAFHTPRRGHATTPRKPLHATNGSPRQPGDEPACKSPRMQTAQQNEYEGVTELKAKLRERQEHLRKLKLAHRYQKDSNMTNLDELIDKWRTTCRSVLEDLVALVPDGTIKDLLSAFCIEPEMVDYNVEAECFE